MLSTGFKAATAVAIRTFLLGVIAASTTLPARGEPSARSAASPAKATEHHNVLMIIIDDGRGNHVIRDADYRYIHYRNGDEELYDHRTDKYEWTNLAADPKYDDVKERLKKYLPKDSVPRTSPKSA